MAASDSSFIYGFRIAVSGRAAGSLRRVIERRFGLSDDQEQTLTAIGREIGVTRERIRQIETTALKKLRHPSRAKRLRGFGWG